LEIRRIPSLYLEPGFQTPIGFSAGPAGCQILVAMTIIAKLSFWKMKHKQSIIGSFGRQSLKESLMDAFEQFKSESDSCYAEKLKTSITSDLLPFDHQELLVFMCNLSQVLSG